MAEVSGDFEIHLTVSLGQPEKLEAFADRHGLKYILIMLDRGRHLQQPMLTIRGSGTLAEQQKLALHWRRELTAATMYVSRTKIEAAPWNDGVPQTDEAAATEPRDRYFEHHVKLVLPTAHLDRLVEVTELVTPHGARLSRNARRELGDGGHERFVTQRCHQVGAATAQERLDDLLDALRGEGHEIAEIEAEYVVHDSALHLDAGWLEPVPANPTYEDRKRHALAGTKGYPSTYRPLPETADVRQRAAFDPALKQFPHA